MSRLFYHTMQDNLGNLLFDVTGTMRLAGSGTLATIYGDPELTIILPNPMTNHPSFGSFKCYVGAAAYDFYMAKPGYTFETLTGIQGLGSMAQQDSTNVAISGGTATFTGLVQGAAGFAVSGNIPGDNVAGLLSNVTAGGGTNRWNINAIGTAPNNFAGLVQAHQGLDVTNGATIAGGAAMDRLGIAAPAPLTTGDVHIGNHLGIGIEPGTVDSLRTVSHGNFGGYVQAASGFTAPTNIPGNNVSGLLTNVAAGGGTNRWNINAIGTAPNNFAGLVGMGGHDPAAQVTIKHPKGGVNGLVIAPTDNDTGGLPAVLFKNVAGGNVGSIMTNATVTAYNTTSDGRLKEDVTPLAGALETIRALRPVQFRWKMDGSLGHGLIAQEVEPIVPGVVSGTETLGIDYGKLVPWLVSAVKELTQQVEMLTAKLAAAASA